MELSVFGAFNVQGAADRDHLKCSEADSDGAGFTEALSECMESGGSAAPESEEGVDGRIGAPKDAFPGTGRFHNLRKKPCEDAGQDKGLDLDAPLQDEEPLEGATLVENVDPLPAVGLFLSEGQHPVEPETQVTDKNSKDSQSASISYIMPFHPDAARFKAPSSAPTDPSDPVPAYRASTGGERGGLTPHAGLIGQDRWLAPETPLRDGEPPEGATLVENVDPLPAVGLVFSEGQRPVEPETQGTDKNSKDPQSASILYPMPLYPGNARFTAPSSAPTAPSDSVPAYRASTGGERGGLIPSAGLTDKAGQVESVSKEAVAAGFATGAANGVDAGIHISSAVDVNPENVVPADSVRADEDNEQWRADGGDDGGTEPRAVKGGLPGPERHGLGSPGVLRDVRAAGAEPARFDINRNADASVAPAAQGGSSGSGGSGQTDGEGLEGEGGAGIRFVKDAGPSGAAAFAVEMPAEKAFVDASKNTDTRTRGVAPDNDIYDRLDSGLNIAVTRGAKEVFISLHPEHLGAIRIRLNMEDASSNAVSARITVDSMEVKGLLDADAGALMEAFSRQGLKLDGYTIELAKNAFGADGGDSYHPDGAGAWGGDAGGFRDGAAYRGPGGRAARNGGIDEGAHNGSTHRLARPGGGGPNAVDLFA